eukprot:gnl/TRDRNA2_/TRDRNA2_185671_c0_seq1.p1 gnl/TRDRNA2_/TRDRNA2_185671_c0~~gnl/TRDRNA2_/TRDRNA2_185671_c0_seq1.p1  ORF type:complete len:179 (+),score=22.13 gnl/TRDRNA2_/TRDRNA2_185671_c0_seq1:457-993(+)
MDQVDSLTASQICNECGSCQGTGTGSCQEGDVQCEGTRATWDVGYGNCTTYALGSLNNIYCDEDSDGTRLASAVCSECGKCFGSGTGHCDSPTVLAVCKGTPSDFDAGFGGCTTYAPGMQNSGYCDKDVHGHLTAMQVCSECGKCNPPGWTPKVFTRSRSSQHRRPDPRTRMRQMPQK